MRHLFSKRRNSIMLLICQKHIQSYNNIEKRHLSAEVALLPLDCLSAYQAKAVKDAEGVAKPFILDRFCHDMLSQFFWKMDLIFISWTFSMQLPEKSPWQTLARFVEPSIPCFSMKEYLYMKNAVVLLYTCFARLLRNLSTLYTDLACKV